MYANCRVLAFHNITSKFSPGINNISPGHFFEIIDLIGGFGFELTGKSPDVAISFDDGYTDIIPVCEELIDREIYPVIFIPSGYIGISNAWEYSSVFFKFKHLNNDELRALAKLGVIFGSHGKSHRSLANMSFDRARRELVESKRLLENTVGPIDSISFPFGRTNEAVNKLLPEIGYKWGFTMGQKWPDTYILPRIPLYGIDDYYSLRNKLAKQSGVERIKSKVINALAGGTIFTSGNL